MAAILTLFVCPMPLHMVIVQKSSVNGKPLCPRSGPRELRVCHFSGYIEVRLYIVLPGLPLLDTLFSDPKRGIHIHGLVTGKNPTSVTDNGRWRAEARECGKEHLHVVPLILCQRQFARQDSAGVVFQNTNHVDRFWKA